MGRKNPNYRKIRKRHQELGVPWTDNTFPPHDSSIGLKKVIKTYFLLQTDVIPYDKILHWIM